MHTTNQHPVATCLTKGAVAGFIGGLVGTWAMTKFQNAAAPVLMPKDDEAEDASDNDDDTTVKAAEGLSKAVFDHRLNKREKAYAGPAMHYGFGGTMGAVYGAAAEVLPDVRAGHGTGYGSALFLAADEVVVPAIGLAPPPTQSPPASHAFGFASHLVYGFATEFGRRTVRSLI